MEESLNEILQNPKRKLVVALDEIVLDKMKKDHNIVFILMVEESFGSAGGRGGGSGNRKIDKITGFDIQNKEYKKIYETEDRNKIDKFEIPYSAVAMDITLSSGEPYVIQGIIDPVLIKSYLKIIE